MFFVVDFIKKIIEEARENVCTASLVICSRGRHLFADGSRIILANMGAKDEQSHNCSIPLGLKEGEKERERKREGEREREKKKESKYNLCPGDVPKSNKTLV